VFPEENTSGVDKFGNPLPPGSMHMSRKGNDLVRSHLWNAARAAIVHNPTVGALYRRLKAHGKRGDVALGHGMRKLLHLVYAVWKTNRPFDEKHWAGEAPRAATQDAAAGGNETAVGHKRDVPAEEVVTTATATVAPLPAPIKPLPANGPARPKVDFAFLRQHVTLEQVLRHLGLFDQLRGRGLHRRGPCPIHGQPNDRQPIFRLTWASTSSSAFTRTAPPTATSWTCGRPCTTCRCTRPPCIWQKPFTCRATEKRNP
jgi:hypothetical protein